MGGKEEKMNQELYDQMLNAGLVMLYREKSKKELLKLNSQVKAKEYLLEEKKSRISEKPFKERKGWGIFLSILGGLFFWVDLAVYTIYFINNPSIFSIMVEEDFSGFLPDIIVGIVSGIVFGLGLFLSISSGTLRKKYILQATEEYKLEEEVEIGAIYGYKK